MRTAPIARRAVLLLALLAAPLALAPEAKQPGSAWKPGSVVPAVIVRWHDGDTLTASALGEQLRVRLIGIDAPEVSDNPRARDQARRLGVPVSEVLALGQAALRFARQLAPEGNQAALELDAQTTDRYGRLLAYLWKDALLVNLELARAGWACPLTIPPNVRHSQAIARAAREARHRGASACP